MKRRALLFILIFFSWSRTQAGELYQFGETVRSFGMGGIRIADPKDASGFLWNPANLVFQKGMNFELFQINMGINGEIFRQAANPPTFNGPQDLNKFYGKHVWFGGEGQAAFALPYFGFAAYQNAFVDFLLHNPAYPTLDMDYINDVGATVGFGLPVGPNIGWGLNVRKLTRTGGPQTIGPDLLNSAGISGQTLINQFTNKGTAWALDSGVMMKLPVLFNPTLSLSWQDLGSTAFTMTGGSTAPDRIKDNLTLSTTFSAESLLGGVAGGLEYRNITNNDMQLGKKIYAGAEVSLLMFDLRAGFYQGYTTYGLGIDLWILQIDAALYTSEQGAYTGQTPDQRAQIGLTCEFGFDPDFNLTDVGGRKRRLKQRR